MKHIHIICEQAEETSNVNTISTCALKGKAAEPEVTYAKPLLLRKHLNGCFQYDKTSRNVMKKTYEFRYIIMYR
jgi:hypothetical protein